MTNIKKEKKLAFIFPASLAKRIKKLQKDMQVESSGEVLVKAISLLELSIGRRVEIKQDKNEKWEIDEFEGLERTVNIHENPDK